MQSRKIIISVAGAALFLVAGAFSMMFLPSEEKNNVEKSSSKNPPSNMETESPKPPVLREIAKEEKAPSASELCYVYVTGAVNKQGVYKFPAGSRIYQAIDAAGGFTQHADSAALNLADLITDKMHIHVETLKPQQAASIPEQSVRVPGMSQPRTASTPSPASTLININTASEQELQRLNGVGPAIAKRIVEYRQTHGAFSRVEDIVNVRGIGSKTLEKFRSQITLSGGGGSYVSGSSPSTSGGLININTASESELQKLKGIGPAMAKRIIEYRRTHGAFSRVEDLVNVRGIGAKTLEKFRSQITVR